MTIRKPALFAILALLGWSAEQASAQPIAPPRRPTFSSYNSLLYPGGGYYGYGMGGPGVMLGMGMGMGGMGMGGMGMGGMGGFGWGGGMMQQNMMIQQQLNQTNQTLNNLQTFIATGVNPRFPSTGHAAVYSNLGHWYPMAAMGMHRGGLGGSMSSNQIGQRAPGAASTGMGAPGSPASKTAGSGIPVPGGR